MIRVAELTVGIFFLITLLLKLKDVTGFAASIEQLLGFTRALSKTLAIAILTLEALIALFAIGGFYPYVNAVLALSFLIACTLVVGFHLWKGHTDKSCGCYGPKSRNINKFLLLRNFGLISLCALSTVQKLPAATVASTFAFAMVALIVPFFY